jgi:carbohydrate-binding DOMON domain-containing protein
MPLLNRIRRHFLALAVVLAALVVPSPALAGCGTDVLNELLANGGAIPSYHTQACYSQALDLLGEDAKVYTNYESVIRSSMRRDRVVDRKISASGEPTTDEPRTPAGSSSSTPSATITAKPATETAEQTTTTTTTDAAPGPSATLGEPPGSDGVVSGALEAAGPERVDQVPLPVIILGVLAAMLIAAGALSSYLRRRTGRLH